MRDPLTGVLHTYRQRRALRRWERLAEVAQETSIQNLREIRNMARQVRQRLSTVNHIAEARLSLPTSGTAASALPFGTDWAGRPVAWSGPVDPAGHAPARSETSMGDDVTLYHDCRQQTVSLRQVRNTRDEDLAPYGMVLEVYGFDGTFLSLVFRAAPDGVAGISRNHLLRLDLDIEAEQPLTAYARLNVKAGPNNEQVTRQVPLSGSRAYCEFDLAYMTFRDQKVDQVWIDLFVEDPAMTRILIRDVILSRRLRAET
jgi:hypothetical protein